jgi:hypothetical protein
VVSADIRALQCHWDHSRRSPAISPPPPPFVPIVYSYVAVSGLPIARKDHALAMARFASDCLDHFNTATNELEKSLGPGTAELALRIGLHR